MWKDRRAGVFIHATQRDPASPVESQLSSKTRAVDSLTSKNAPGISMNTCATSISGSSADAGHIYGDSSPNMAVRSNTPVVYGMAPTPNPRSNPTISKPATNKSSVRLVGRGGQGSRPRILSAEDIASTAPGIHRSLTVEAGALSRGDSTRIVGRGGIGSRPRDLPAPARVTLPLHPPPTSTPTPTPLNQPAAAPMLYRPGGRGGAGSKPRAPKLPPETRETAKSSSKFTWKGKGKESGNASTYGAPSLSRTDTMNTTESSVIQFLPARRTERAYQTTVGQDPIPEVGVPSGSSHGSSPSIDAAARRTPRLHKLLRTLGAEVMSPKPQSATTQTQTKTSRRSSVSGFSMGSNVDSVPDTFDSRIAEQELRRRSSYESLQSISDYQYPTPPRPPPAFPDDPAHEVSDDSHSESLTYASTDDNHSELRTISSTSTDPLRFNQSPSLLESDAGDDDDYQLGRSPTPTAMTVSAHEKHFSSMPFESVFDSTTPAWESANGVIRDEIGWTGEWNCGDIQEVISSLRELRL